ncbi:MAG: hypothetical protein A2958_03230 [Candidatus Levybacteria bacterium RIFCSPLOWO2_01_FULL_38_13]|nr:MAG: hypothetical protein A2629_03645 [Candidatus Levybacteria bacterium RIFCSPHIGHO2_01_FULL_41_15]OGH35327.1 MAG: hypothetical protein A2958_03230 [Candidatus Levybacteria bacterium RIFCSPLOWO2_01_FULL_38_13]
MIYLLVLLGKVIIFISKTLNIGSGSTWPGHIAVETYKDFIKRELTRNKHLKIVLIAGTNGKTTTGKLIRTILEENGNKVFQNEAGANLLNGIASSLIKNSNLVGNIKFDYAIFEVDENTLSLVLDNLKPRALVLLNLFRDQLDRYGEVNIVANKWKESLEKIDIKTSLILNADDPKIAFLGNNKNNSFYFSVKGESFIQEHASDSTYCPRCGEKLSYERVTFSHLGNWKCKKCGLKRKKPDIENYESYPLPGIYNKYNTHAAILTARVLKIGESKIKNYLKKFKPAFGRQETIEYNGKNIQIFLSKNPASFNQSLQTINELKAKNVLFVLNDRIPDGLDVSWIWDVDFENYFKNFRSVSVSGDRVYDMALRLQYANNESRITYHELKIYEDLKEAIGKETKKLKAKEILYILPTYSAMLDLRKILTGKKLL